MRSINDITPKEWDAMGRPRKEKESVLQAEYDAHEAKRMAEMFLVDEPLFKTPLRIPMDVKERSDGSTASYYELPKNATELQDLISHRNMNAQIGEIFRECYRYGRASHSDEMRGIKKILFYANAELKRLGG